MNKQMAICLNCKRTVPDTSAFCLYCGKKMEKLINCPHCNQLIKAGSAFCAYCGESVEESRSCHKCKTDLEENQIFCPNCGLKRYVSGYVSNSVGYSRGKILYQSSAFSYPNGERITISVCDDKIKIFPYGEILINSIIRVSHRDNALIINSAPNSVHTYLADEYEVEFLDYITRLIKDCITQNINLQRGDKI